MKTKPEICKTCAKIGGCVGCLSHEAYLDYQCREYFKHAAKDHAEGQRFLVEYARSLNEKRGIKI